MSTCRWCTLSGSDTTEFLKSYASEQLSLEEFEGSNDDLCYCLECVVEYHKAREKLPRLHKVLWELETSRLVAHIEKSMREEAADDDDELFLVDEQGETRLSGYVGPEFENNLRVPILEILKYPYLLLHEKVSELCVEVLCRMEQSHSSFQVFDKYPGIYLFLVHPNEVIRRWAILTARNLGKVDRDDYYDLQEVLTCLFKVIELGLFESPDIYSFTVIEKGKLILLPSHLYDTANYKNYWLGICMLLTVLEEQAMDSLLLGPDKQNDFMQSILHTMEKEAPDDSTDPFWPALHCFMVILDQLGSKVWGQLIDPVQAFQTIINSVSYNNEIKNIRNSFKRTKSEPEPDYDDDMVTCSQIVYNYNTEKPQKDAGWKTAICPDYCPNMYEEMQTLANMLQSDIGRDTRIHDSTFLWFIPFVQSLMDLKDLGVAYIVEVIHYLCSEIKDTLNERFQQCDKISEFFLLILVSIIELHRNKKCLHLLWICSQEWVEAVVRCAKLPAIAFTLRTDKVSGHCVKSSSISFQASNSVQHSCVQLIRSLLKEGYQIGQHALCKQYLDKLNLLLRGNVSLGWHLNVQETQELQLCLKQVIRNIKGRVSHTSAPVALAPLKVNLLCRKMEGLVTPYCKNQENSVHDIKRKVKGAVRSSSDGQSSKSSCVGVCLDNQVIVISDSSDEEGRAADKKGAKKMDENVCPEEQPATSSCVSESKPPGSPLLLEDCESQCFEFETQADIFSAWQDTQDYSMEATQEYKQECVSTVGGSSNSDGFLNDHTNEWGYDVDYLSDDAMEEADLIEKQIESVSHQKEGDNTKEVVNSTLQESISKENAKEQLENFADKGTVAKHLTLDSKSTEPRASTSNISLASKLALKKSSVSPRKNIAKSKGARTILRSPKNPFVLKTAQNKKLLQSTLRISQPDRSMPAVVPPRKVRQCPAPASTVEKLGLKKAPRKAFELSQRSLDSITQLRSHGKAAGRIGVPQKRETKQIAAQSLYVKHNKKFLACQERQYLRQTRPKKSVRAKNPAGSSESRNKKVSTVSAKSVKRKPENFELASVENQREKKRETVSPSASKRKFESLSCVSKMLSSSDLTGKSEGYNRVVPPVPVDSSLNSSVLAGHDKNEPSGKGCVVQPEHEKTTSKENGCTPDENSEDDDDLFLTQREPEDMELCSQEESVRDTTIASKKPEEMDTAESIQQNESLTVVKCEYKDCVEKVGKPGEYCSKHSATTSSAADHLFVKPSLLPPSKIRKPSTTKIFSSVSSSRNAALSKDLENVPKVSPASKSKASAVKQVVIRPPSTKAVPRGNQPCGSPSFSNLPQPRAYDNVLQPQNRQNNVPSNYRPAREASFIGAQQRDHSVFVKEVLKWTYDMFVNSSQFGPPSNLLQSVVAAVPVQFQGYNDYFNTFFPLMMLNAFETLAQDWIENQKAKEKCYLFCLQNFCADLNTADFKAPFRETDLARQLHPKEDDLILLVVQKKKDPFREDSEMETHIVNHVGLVTRFSRASGSLTRQKEQHTICHLSVQTRGNLSFFINKEVKCVVLGSLVTVHRTFKGLLLLSRSPLAKPIIDPRYQDFCPRDLPVASESAVSPAARSMNEYNENQKRAIETAYAMVKQHPGLPKICLIHGPPGTGKSKTIVGLLSRVLRENTRNEKTAQTSSKIKKNRFLVCAPSNAAVDELMKKIIIAFKEKCQNKQEPLGNCGDIKLVRLGAEKAINSEVRGFSLDKQVEHRMKRKPTDYDRDLQKKKEALDQKLDMLSRQRARQRCEKRESQMLDDEIGRLSKERQQLASQLKEVRGHSQKVQTDIILESDIICCTLSTSGGVLLESTFLRRGVDSFSCVVVDEAGQSCEVETLIPLIHRCNKLVLVGDPRQLPPTVKSVKAQEYGYDQSLMARLHKHLEEQVQKNVLRSLPVVQLTVQYRMHPDICLFPSNYVYGRTLKTDKATEENRCSSEWPFQPYLIFDVGDGREERDKDSFSNPQEVKLVLELIKTIKEKRKDLGLRRIGIITPYSAQKKKIQEQLDRVFGRDMHPGEVDTVDAFQGREKDCVIVTCVRANSTRGSIGFLASLQRLNVTITRARFSLFILGRLETLMENRDWNELIQDAHKRGAIIKTSEENYRKDAVKILKFRSTVRPPTKPETKKSPLQPCSSSSKRDELASPKEVSSPTGHVASAGHTEAEGPSRQRRLQAPGEAAPPGPWKLQQCVPLIERNYGTRGWQAWLKVDRKTLCKS
ncbi:PREDICTED: probable helicase senataxin [Apaloderma vittatum]|uniref:probable helicase senataxin n=1 Tax=Apaloderma vittatum TaxID=57397 RepID=UPI0005217697|nr:PREDICTED: probable helicase senataxin [Apaloderma vittatum]